MFGAMIYHKKITIHAAQLDTMQMMKENVTGSSVGIFIMQPVVYIKTAVQCNSIST